MGGEEITIRGIVTWVCVLSYIALIYLCLIADFWVYNSCPR